MAPISAAVAPSPPRERRVKVGVRLRPFSDHEKVRAGGKAAWTWHESTIYQQIFPAQIPPRRLPGASTAARARPGGSSTSSASSVRDPAAFPSSYALDRLFPPAARTSQVYDETVKDGVLAALEGYHSSVFVYGQTGTGKTYTMQGTREDPGVIPLAVQDIFQHVAARAREAEFVLRFSYFEIYNERFFDLLAAGAKADVKMYDVTSRGGGLGSSGGSSSTGSSNGGVKDVVLKGLREELVVSPEHVLSLVEVGNLHRHLATTDANDQSSRSHVIFRMIIESQPKRAPMSGNQQQSQAPIRLATLNLIDLAGSESVRLANTAGQHLDEGKYINRSLLTLGHIVWKLSRRARSSSAGPKAAPTSNRLAHLPFRNSKLTRVLQPALSGHAHVAVICTAAPSVECLMETHGTLKFATRARRVTTRAIINELSAASSSDNGSVLRKYRARLRELQDQLDSLERRRSGGGRSGPSSASNDERRVELQFAVRNLERSILNAGPPPVVEPPPARSIRSPRMAELEPARSMPHLRTVAEDREVESTPPRVLRSARPTLAAARSSGSESLGNSNKTLVGSGGSGSTKTLPLSSSSSRGLADLGDDDGETKGDEDQDEPEHEEAVAERPSLTTVLMDKYAAELARLESAEVDARERERLREFVRGLEIAQAEQETRMSKIRELEVENRRLRELVGSQPSA